MSESNHYAARIQKVNAQMCECGHAKGRHFDGVCWGEPCSCTRFKKVRSATRRSTRKYAKGAERSWAEHVGGKRVPAGVAAQQRQGDCDVSSPNRVWQIKQVAKTPPSLLLHAWDQAAMAAIGTGKRPLVGLTIKGGRGREAKHFVIEERSQWVDFNGRDTEMDSETGSAEHDEGNGR